MIWWITTNTGDDGVNFMTDAKSLDTALELMAHKFEYPTYAAFCADLGYQGSDFTVSIIEDERNNGFDLNAQLKRQAAERSGLVLGAWRHVRKLAGG